MEFDSAEPVLEASEPKEVEEEAIEAPEPTPEFQDMPQKGVELEATEEDEDVPQEQASEPEPSESEEEQRKQEIFEDVRKFNESLTYGKVTGAANPPFSIIVKDIRYKEDAEDILLILKDAGIVTDTNEEQYKKSMQNGSALISQISEYSAVYLTHKLRRFDVNLLMGLSEEVHPPKSYRDPKVGLVGKEQLMQNRREMLDLSESKIDMSSILLTTTPTVQDHQIMKYLGVATEYAVVSENQIKASKASEEELALDAPNMNEIYKELANRLRPQALKLGGNAVVGMTYQLVPLVPEDPEDERGLYKVTCTGSVVVVS
jgi:uncharacterized protein YbjQ (UPF0145 family)